jgi:hypothetical protein
MKKAQKVRTKFSRVITNPKEDVMKKSIIKEVLEEVPSFVVKAQDMEDDLSLFLQDEESQEETGRRETNRKNYLLGYTEQKQLAAKEELNDELKMLIAEQDMDGNDYVFSGSGKLVAPLRVTIQKYFEMEKFSEVTMQDEIIKGWFNLTSQDMSLGTSHKKKDPKTGNEYRVAHVFEMEADKVITKGDSGRYDIDISKIKDDLTMNLSYIAGSFYDLVVIDGEQYRMVVSHSMLSEVIGIDYNEDTYKEYEELDGGAVLGVMPKEKYAFDTNQYKENQHDSSKEIMFGRAADVLKGTTALFYSEWQARRAQLSEEGNLTNVCLKVKVAGCAAKLKAMSSPFYVVVKELNALYHAGDICEMQDLADEHSEDADDILDYARRNRNHASLFSDRKVLVLTPYLAVRSHKTKIAKKVESKASLIEESVAELVRELKRTMDLDLITPENAEDVLEAARAGGEFRMNDEFQVLYFHAKEVAEEAA